MKNITLFVCILFTTALVSQNTLPKPYIEVRGESEIEVVPDEIYLDIKLDEKVERGKKLTIASLEREFKNALNKIGIPEDNLSIADVNAVLAKTGWWREEVLASANYSLKVNGADKLKQVFEYLKKMEISDVNITKATHSNLKELKNKNSITAIQNAKKKADELLAAIGEKTGKPIVVNEINNNQPYYANVNYLRSDNNKLNKTEGYESKVVEFKKIKIKSTIYVKFLIE